MIIYKKSFFVFSVSSDSKEFYLWFYISDMEVGKRFRLRKTALNKRKTIKTISLQLIMRCQMPGMCKRAHKRFIFNNKRTLNYLQTFNSFQEMHRRWLLWEHLWHNRHRYWTTPFLGLWAHIHIHSSIENNFLRMNIWNIILAQTNTEYTILYTLRMTKTKINNCVLGFGRDTDLFVGVSLLCFLHIGIAVASQPAHNVKTTSI